MPKIASVYQLRVSLIESEPEIWRRVLVPADIKLPGFHLVLQAAMGWRNCHLHMFRDAGHAYSPIPEDLFLDEKSVRLCDLLQEPGQTLEYEYDMGDSWLHIVEVEQILEAKTGKTYPLCIDGVNDCPPEDCGGMPGYEHLLDVLSRPKHPEHRDLKRWMDDYELEPFDLTAINRRLSVLAPKTLKKKISVKTSTTRKKTTRRGVWVLDPRKAGKRAR